MSIAVRVTEISKIYQLVDASRVNFSFLRKLISHKVDKKETITKKYRDFYALKDISFNIQKGESWGIIGLNGSGKSTLLKIISGNLRPSTGQVEVNGKVVILDYGNGFNGDFTGKENIYFKATLLGLTRKQIKERYNSIIAFAELGEFIDQPVKTYSSGMLSRLGFAIIAHVDADIIITDEALAVGDIYFVQKCMRFIKSFLKKGTFLFVSHSTNDVISLCQKAIWLDKGHIKSLGSAQEVVDAYLNNKELISIDKIGANNSECTAEKSSSLAILSKSLLNKEVQIKIKDGRLKYKDSPSKLPYAIVQGEDLGRAKILNTNLLDENKPISQVLGGEFVTLSIQIQTEHEFEDLIVGFQMLDRLGQIIIEHYSPIADGTETTVILPQSLYSINFNYQMPLLPRGSYVIRSIIAQVLDDNVAEIITALDNGLAFHSVTVGVRHGLVGTPMHSIKMKYKTTMLNELV